MAALVLLFGCGSALGEALEAFEAGRHPEAVARFRALETEFPHWNSEQRLRYALYRGLTHLALGDARQADIWLSQVKREVDADPGVLADDERGRLLAAWGSLGRMPGE